MQSTRTMEMQMEQEELENKKRKVAEKEESSKGQINEHFQRSKKTKAPSALRNSTHAVAPAKKDKRKRVNLSAKGRQLLAYMLW